jgi:hypothetical protein
VTFLTPGLRFLHEGQREGFGPTSLAAPVPGAREATDAELAAWYDRLVDLLADPLFRDGDWTLATCEPVTEQEPADAFVAWTWRRDDGPWRLVVVNYGPEPGRCHVRLPFDDLAGATFELEDRVTDARFERRGDDLARYGLYVELPGWGAHVLAVERVILAG